MGFGNPFMALMIYSTAIITMPIATFFGVKSGVETFMPDAEGNVYGAIASVIIVHVILFAFVYRAFQEEKVIAKEAGQKQDWNHLTAWGLRGADSQQTSILFRRRVASLGTFASNENKMKKRSSSSSCNFLSCPISNILTPFNYAAPSVFQEK